MAGPKVSICVPAYKQVHYLRKTLGSIQEQTCRDVEVILTDDSPDDAVERVVNEFRAAMPGLIYHRNRPALGTPANWNKSVSLATGTYVKMMHHDDWFTSATSLATFLRVAEENNLDLVCSAAIAVNEARNETKQHKPASRDIQRIFDNPHRLLLGNLIGPPSSVLYRRDIGVLFNERHKFVVDHEFYRDFLWRTKKAAYIENTLITSISGGDHNVTNSCFTPEIDLKENLDLYPLSASRFRSEELPELVRYLADLFTRYAIRSKQDLLLLKPDLVIDGTIRKALAASRMKGAMHRSKMRVANSALFKWLVPSVNRDHQTSWSQCGEDMIIAHVFRALKVHRPFFVDIGAHHPRYINNTYFFYKQGARGVNIEPDPNLIQRFARIRPQDVNLNFGVTHELVDSVADFHIFNVPTLNTFSKEEADRVQADDPAYRVVETRKVPIRNINNVLAQYASEQRIDLLSLDVEGLDDKLIIAMDFARFKPLLICLETISHSTSGEGVKNDAIIRFVTSQGYLLYADTNVNSIFVLEREWRDPKG